MTCGRRRGGVRSAGGFRVPVRRSRWWRERPVRPFTPVRSGGTRWDNVVRVAMCHVAHCSSRATTHSRAGQLTAERQEGSPSPRPSPLSTGERGKGDVPRGIFAARNSVPYGNENAPRGLAAGRSESHGLSGLRFLELLG